MREREADDTPKPGGPPPPAGDDAPPGSYYYDDATGYEIYDPEADAEDDEATGGSEE